MIQVRFKTYELDPETTEWVEQPVAEMIADGQEVTISGPHADWINLDISIVDPESGEKVTRADDAERWARLLPYAYRSGDIAVRVNEVQSASPAAGAFRYTAAA
jgi:hypothetical protein